MELLEKMAKARRIYQDQLRTICQRARKENRKMEEVVYIQRERAVGERESLDRNAFAPDSWMSSFNTD